MLQTTVQAIRAVLQADPFIPPHERAALVATIRRGSADTTANNSEKYRAPRLIRRAEASERLSVSTRTIDALAAAGTLRRVRLPGRTRSAGFVEADIVALMSKAEGGAA